MLLRVGRFCFFWFAFFWQQKTRTGAQDSAIGPVFFVEKDFAFAGITVIPAGQKPQMFAEFGAGCGGRFVAAIVAGLHLLRSRCAALAFAIEFDSR